jgi:hypothetical protein
MPACQITDEERKTIEKPRAGAERSSAIWEDTARNQGNWSMLIWDQ